MHNTLDAFRNDIAQQTAKLAVDLLALDPDTSTLIEFGFGAGCLTRQLLPLVHRLVAIDKSLQAVARLKQRATYQGLTEDELLVLTLDEANAPLPDRAVGSAAVSALVLHHLSEPAAALQTQIQHVMAGGWILAVDVLPDTTTHRLSEQSASAGCWRRLVSPDSVVGWFKAAGLGAVSWRQAFTSQIGANTLQCYVVMGCVPLLN